MLYVAAGSQGGTFQDATQEAEDLFGAGTGLGSCNVTSGTFCGSKAAPIQGEGKLTQPCTEESGKHSADSFIPAPLDQRVVELCYNMTYEQCVFAHSTADIY